MRDYLYRCELKAEQESAEVRGDSQAALGFAAAGDIAEQMVDRQAAELRELRKNPNAKLAKKPPSILRNLIKYAGQLAGLKLRRRLEVLPRNASPKEK